MCCVIDFNITILRIANDKHGQATGRQEAPRPGHYALHVDKVVGDGLRRTAVMVIDALSSKHRKMVFRYAYDLEQMMREAARVLRRNGRATYVLGNSCLKETFIQNSEGVTRAAEHAGLELLDRTERDLPAASRYLPMTTSGSLSKRMRTETILNRRQHGVTCTLALGLIRDS